MKLYGTIQADLFDVRNELLTVWFVVTLHFDNNSTNYISHNTLSVETGILVSVL